MTSISAADRQLFAHYRMPAEWEPHLATYFVWPHNLDTWPGKFEPIPHVFAMMGAAIASSEPVRILIRRGADQPAINNMIAGAAASMSLAFPADRIELVEVATNDSWIRDHGPIFVNRMNGDDPQQIALDWQFNSWGEKYGEFDLDDAVPRRLAEVYGFSVKEPGIVLEGGSIDVNGKGSLLTTESCLLNKNRNPGLSRHEIEEYLRIYLGIEQVLWLGEGIAGDDTDGHVDDLARFVRDDTILTVIENDPADLNYRPLRENLMRLRATRDLSGNPFNIETLPMPPALVYDGTRLPASYANFYIANRSVIVPSFGCAQDAVAAETLARLFPGRRIMLVPSTDLVWGLGAIHCLTQQHPAACRNAAR